MSEKVPTDKESHDVSDEIIDAYLDLVLRASGSALRHYSLQKTRADMRNAMRKFLADMTE